MIMINFSPIACLCGCSGLSVFIIKSKLKHAFVFFSQQLFCRFEKIVKKAKLYQFDILLCFKDTLA